MHYVATDDFCQAKTVYIILIHFSKFLFVLFWSLCILLGARHSHRL
jgi:hypothetical protein